MSELPEERPARRSWTIRLAVGAVALGLLAAFVAENFSEVEVRLLITTERIRLAWALLIASGLGFVIGYFSGWWRRR
jgi:uncharacterized integral membrane protein